jgi:branched-chain amino acid aminotransferase
MSEFSQWFNYNGRLQSAHEADFPGLNRGFRLGDGFFETVRIIGGEPHLWESHYARVVSCCKSLQLILPGHYSSAFFLDAIGNLVKKGGISDGGRLRITFFREGEGSYRPETSKVGFLMEVKHLPATRFQVRDEGLQLGLYTGLTKHQDRLAKYKLLGNHVYIQAAIWAEANNFDDALIVNNYMRLVEATSSNLFLVRSGEIHTTPVSDGCVGGVMRMAVLNAAMQEGIPCFESQMDESDLLLADEIFLTNAVQGISWVRSFREKRYYHKLSDRLILKINEAHFAELNGRKDQLSVGSEGK